MRKAKVFMKDTLAGSLLETDEGYEFVYDKNYVSSLLAEAVSLTLLLTELPRSVGTPTSVVTVAGVPTSHLIF